MNFVDTSKKKNKCHDRKVSAKKYDKKNVSKFLAIGFSKELVITVGNEPILINTFFRYGII